MTSCYATPSPPDGGWRAPQEGGDLVAELVAVGQGGEDDRVLGAGGDEHGVGEGGRLVGALHRHHLSQGQDHPHQARDLGGREGGEGRREGGREEGKKGGGKGEGGGRREGRGEAEREGKKQGGRGGRGGRERGRERGREGERDDLILNFGLFHKTNSRRTNRDRQTDPH